MKKILVIVAGLLLLFPVKNTFANDFTNGYFDSNSPLSITNKNVIDNDLSTAVLIFFQRPVTIVLSNSIDITSFYIKGLRSESTLIFYDSSGKIIEKQYGGNAANGRYVDILLNDVKKIEIHNDYGDTLLYEFELFEKEKITYSPVTNLTETHNHSTINLYWNNPDSSNFSETIIKKDGVELARIPSSINNYSINGLKADTSYSFEVLAKYSDGGYSVDKTISIKTDIAPTIENIRVTPKHNSAEISWKHPLVTDSTGIRILKEGMKVIDLNKLSTSYKITGLIPETSYKYEVVVLYKDFESSPMPITFTTLEKPGDAGEIDELKATATHNRVNLSWTLPDSEILKHVNIYREKKTRWFSNILTQKAYAAGTKIFETNGTYFNDLTVTEDTTYEYTLTTQSIESVESQGVKVQVKTAKAPEVPNIEGGDYERDEKGDFLYTWTSPTTGKVKVLIDGKEYKTVEASLKQILIPSADMKYDIFNNPKVQLVPISEDGKEGKPTAPKPGGSGGGTGAFTIPFGVKELLETGFGLLMIVGPFVLLGLSFLLIRPLREVIRKALLNHRERSIHK